MARRPTSRDPDRERSRVAAATPGGAAPVPRRWPGALAVGVGAALLLAALALWLAPRLRAVPAVVLPANLERLDPAVQELIRAQVAAVEAAPRDARARGRLALAYEANLLWSEARSTFAQAVELAPDEPAWSLHLAVALRQAGDASAALDALRDYTARYPDDAPGRQRLGHALLETGDLGGALSAFRRVAELAPGSAAGYAGMAEVLNRQKDFAAAAQQGERAVALDPGYRMAHYLLGLAYRGLGREADASRELALGTDAAIRFLPDGLSAQADELAVSLTAQNDRALAFLQAGRPDDAVRILTATLAHHPGNGTVLNNLAIAYMHQGLQDKAFATLSQALAGDDRKFNTYINLSSWAQRGDRPDLALEYADQAVERGPAVARAHSARAQALLRLGRFEEAAASLETALTLDFRDAQARLSLAAVDQQLGRLEAAREQYRELIRINPAVLPAHLGLARVELALGHLPEASAALAEARRLAPDHPQVGQLEAQLAARRQGAS